MARNGFVLTIASLVLFSLAVSRANAQAPAGCPKCPNCPDASKMVPLQAHGVTIFFDPIGKAYYYQGKKYAVLNDKNEAVLVPADAPPAETVPPGGQATPQAPTGQSGIAVAQTLGVGTPVPVGGSGTTSPTPAVAAPSSGTTPVGTQATVAEAAATSQLAARSATSAPIAPSALENSKSELAKPQARPELGRGATDAPLAGIVAVKTPLVDQPVNVANAVELAKLNGRWRASVRDFLGNTTVIEMDLQDLATDASATLISQTTGQPPTESKRKVAFTDNKLTLTDGTDAQVLGQIAEANTVRLRINGASGEMLFTRSPAD